jgi:hypothetical protein
MPSASVRGPNCRTVSRAASIVSEDSVDIIS